MLLTRTSCVSALSRNHRATLAGSRRTVLVTCSSSRTILRPASAICLRRRDTRTFSSRSSSLISPRRAALMNEFSFAGSFSVHGAWRARNVKVENAARRPTSRCSGTCSCSLGRCAPANDWFLERVSATGGGRCSSPRIDVPRNGTPLAGSRLYR